MTSAFSTFYIAFDVQQETINTQRDVSRDLVEKTQEQFVISAGADPNDNNRLGIQVKNQGPNPVEVANIWIVNKSDVNEPANRYEVNYQDVFIPPGYGAPILENTPLYLNPAYGNDYTVKVISTLGSIKSAPVSVSGSTNLLAEMFTIPPDVRQGENVTIAMRVTNVGDTPLVDVEPHYIPPDVQPLSEIDASEFISTSPVTLDPTESTIFTWHYKVKSTATVGTKVAFTSAANGTDSATGFDYLSNNATDNIIIRDPQGGSGEEVVLKDSLFAQPGIFMMIPNTFGDDDEEALWGVTVANPTDAPMDVSKITISVLFAGANDNQKIFDSTGPGSDCPHTNHAPVIDDYWQCPNLNQLVWYDSGGYTEIIPPRSAFTFLVGVEPGAITGASGGLDAVVIHASVFTTLGSFGETKWTTSMSNVEEPLVNTYLYEQFPAVSPYADTNFMTGSRINIPSGVTQTFQIGIAELNLSSEHIETDTQLIINIPKQFTNVVLNSWTGANGDFKDTPTVTKFDDGSHQIVGILETDLHSGGRIISFDADPPTPNCDKMYVMHVLANGVTHDGKPIGPVSEIVLQVNPASPCP
jgi:hypothetical protein